MLLLLEQEDIAGYRNTSNGLAVSSTRQLESVLGSFHDLHLRIWERNPLIVGEVWAVILTLSTLNGS